MLKSITLQLAKRSGMSVDKVMEEAMRSLNRIQERTQLSYAWFAAAFLQKLFKSMFSGICIDKNSLQKVCHYIAYQVLVVLTIFYLKDP